MDVSVIIPMRNGGSLIHEQLDALAVQATDLDWEVVVGDNGSTDGSAEAVRARAADDRVARDWVAQAHRAVREIAPMVAGANRRLETPFCPNTELLNPGILHGRGAQTCNAAFRREVFVQVGGFDESLPQYGMEDSNLSARVLAAGHAIEGAPDMVVYFRPTASPLRRLLKIYRSGQSEAVLWSRAAHDSGGELTSRELAAHLASLPREALAQVRSSGRRRLPAEVARQAAVRAGRLAGLHRWVRTGRAGDPVLPFLDSSEAPA